MPSSITTTTGAVSIYLTTVKWRVLDHGLGDAEPVGALEELLRALHRCD